MLVEQWGAAQAHPRVHSALSEYMDELVDEVTDSPFLPAWVSPPCLSPVGPYKRCLCMYRNGSHNLITPGKKAMQVRCRCSQGACQPAALANKGLQNCGSIDTADLHVSLCKLFEDSLPGSCQANRASKSSGWRVSACSSRAPEWSYQL